MKKILLLMVLLSFMGLPMLFAGGGGEPSASDSSSETTEEDASASNQGPDWAAAAAALGIDEQALKEALGPPPPDFTAAAKTLGISADELKTALDAAGGGKPTGPMSTVTINGIDFEIPHEVFTWDELPSDVVYERQPLVFFTNVDGETHTYEAVYVSSGNLNWYQAATLAEDAGGYLASITSEEENDFVFNLVSDEKYFWAFPPGEGWNNHYEISIGPFLGGYQPEGSEEPAGGWSWLSGETWDYTNWAVNLDDGVIDQDPRISDQPNNTGEGQPIMGFGEMNVPVPTWGDYMGATGTYGVARTLGTSYGFVIEYER